VGTENSGCLAQLLALKGKVNMQAISGTRAAPSQIITDVVLLEALMNKM